jgi:hypothetical protein
MRLRPFTQVAQTRPAHVAETSAQQYSRCQGLMVKTWLMDMDGTAEPLEVLAQRCVSCAHLSDDGFATNRPQAHVPKRPRVRRYRAQYAPQLIAANGTGQEKVGLGATRGKQLSGPDG